MQMSLVPDIRLALILAKIEHAGVILIPIFFLHFVFSLVGLNVKRKKYLYVGYFLTVVFLAMLPSNLLVSRVIKKTTVPVQVVHGGPLYPALLIFFSSCVIWGLFELFKEYRRSTSSRRNQMSYSFWGGLIGFLGGAANFLYVSDREIPILNPFSNYGVCLYLMITAWAIAKHRLMDITVFVKRTIIYSILYSLVVGIFVFWVVLLGQLTIYGKVDNKVLWMSIIALFIITFSIRPLDSMLTELTDKFLFRKKYDYKKTLRKASEGMARIRNFTKLLNLIVRLIVNSVRVSHAAIFLRNEKDGSFAVKASYGRKKKAVGSLELKKGAPLILRLNKERNILVTEELDEQIKPEMEKIDAAICVPSFNENAELAGFFVLGNKLSGEMYTQEDIDVFATLSNQAAIAIDNAQAWEELKDTKDRLHQSEKLASVGRLAGGIAHEIKNPLASIKTFVEFLPEEYKDPVFREKFYRIVGSEVDRINTIVEQLVDFSHPKAPKLEETDICQLIENVLILLENDLIKNKVTVKEDYTQGRGLIFVDKNQLEQVFLNLFINSIQAMNSLKNKESNELKIMTYTDKTNFIIEISDTGCGIPAGQLSSIFDPFFTTKEKGSGLGLSIVHGIIKSHGGAIDVKSNVDKGAVFTIKLPLNYTANSV